MTNFPSPPITIPPAIRDIMMQLNKLAPVRVVGGAVRDQTLTALNMPALPDKQTHGLAGDGHYDLAIKTTPDQLKQHAAQQANWRLVLDGFTHGIIRIISGGIMVEVACLRRDVSTDGRHAKVAFGGDWHDDAARRDFTINALYADIDGVVSDPLGIMADFLPLRLKFIGSAAKRIQEDYLRILRYYRFLATLPHATHDANDRSTMASHRAGLKKISHPRVGMELLKILLSQNARHVIMIMQEDNIWQALGLAPDIALLGHITPTIDGKINQWPEHRRAAFYGLIISGEHDAKKFSWPSEINQLLSIYQLKGKTADPFAFHYRHGNDAYHILLLRQWLAGGLGMAEYDELSIMPQPIFPLAKAGDELLARGFTAQDFATTMPRLEKKWLASHGALSKSDLLKDSK